MSFLYDIPISLFPGGVAPDSWTEFTDRVEADAGITSAVLEGRKWQPLVYGTSIALVFDVEPTGDDRSPGPATLEKLIIDGLVAATPPTPVATLVSRPQQYEQTRDPDENDDVDDGFTPGDVWRNTSTGDSFRCRKNDSGAAKWDWLNAWGLTRSTSVPKLRASLKTAGEGDPDIFKAIVTDGVGDFDLLDYGGTRDRGYFEDFGAVTTASSGTPVTRMSENPTLLDGRYLIHYSAELSGSSGATVSEARFSFDGSLIDSFTESGRNKFIGSIERVVTAGTRAMLLEVAKDAGGGSAEMGKSSLRYSWIAAT